MFANLKNNPSVLNAQRQYEALPARDRLALKVLALVFVLLILYFAAWKPAEDFMNQAKSDLAYNQDILSLINTNSAVLAQSSKQSSSNKASLDSQQLVSTVTNMAKQKGVVLKRFEPSGGDKLKVWVDNASFDKMVIWLVSLKKSLGITVEQITIERDDEPGLVSARLTLSS